MRKRILSLLFAIVMLICLVPQGTAFASGTDVESYVSQTVDGESVAQDGSTSDSSTSGSVPAEESGEVTGGEVSGDTGSGESAAQDGSTSDSGTPGSGDETSQVAAVQKLIDALPEASEITAENRSEVEAQLEAIDTAKNALLAEPGGGELTDVLDFTKYDAAINAIEALDGQDGAEDPDEIDNTTLQDAVDAAADDGTETTIYLDDYATDGSLVLDKTLTIPANKNIILTANGSVTVTMDASAEAADRVNMIEVTGGSKLTLAGNVTWDFSNVLNSTTKIGSSIAYPHGIYTDNGSITIQAGTFQNFQASGNNIGAIYITGQNASLRMTGGTISNTKLTKTQWSAPVVVSRGASFVMEAGTICNNYTDGTGTVNGYQNSAGVLVISDYQMEADDGTDSSVLASKYKDTSFVMYGGKISNNETHYKTSSYDMGCGSGVYVHSYNNAYKLNATQQAWLNENVEASFTMYGGEISGNTAFYGGGIVIDAPRSGQGGYGTAAGYLYGGSIINNTATRSGGAIFVGVDQNDNSRSYLYMTNSELLKFIINAKIRHVVNLLSKYGKIIRQLSANLWNYGIFSQESTFS